MPRWESCLRAHLPRYELPWYTLYFFIHRDKWIKWNLLQILCKPEKQTNSFECHTSIFEEKIPIFYWTICPIDRKDELHCFILEFLTYSIFILPCKAFWETKNLKKKIIARLIYRKEIICCHRMRDVKRNRKYPHEWRISHLKKWEQRVKGNQRVELSLIR